MSIGDDDNGSLVCGPMIDHPSHYIPMNVLMILATMAMIFGTEIYSRKVLTNHYNTYPRLRVRPKRISHIYYLLLFLICSLHLWDIIGYDKLPCGLGFISFSVFAQYFLLSASSVLVYSFRVRISQLKREKDISVYKRLKKLQLQRFNWFWRFIFLVIPFSATITFAVLERDIVFQEGCLGCDYVFPGAEYVPKGFFFLFIGSMFLVLIPLFFIRKYHDVFAFIPEFRLNYGFSFPFSVLGMFIIAYDKELFGGIHSQKVLRGHWLICTGLLISFFFSRAYQIHLASIEGQLINPNGVDILSKIWSSLKRRWNQAKVDMFDPDDAPSLEEILSTSTGYQLFEEYSLSEYCVELTRFHKAVKEFEDHYDELSSENRAKEAKGVYKLYIARYSPLEINISDSLRLKYGSIFSNETFTVEDKSIFKEVDKEVLTLLNHGPYLRFQHTSNFQEVRKTLNRKSKKGGVESSAIVVGAISSSSQ